MNKALGSKSEKNNEAKQVSAVVLTEFEATGSGSRICFDDNITRNPTIFSYGHVLRV